VGLGVEVLELKNKCLLSKWLLQLLTEEGIWQELLHNKYIKDKTLSQVQKKVYKLALLEMVNEGKKCFF
jgi:hypothetical protein